MAGATGRAGALCLLMSVWLLQLSSVNAGPVMAVDLGGEFLKISLVRPGRPVSIAINEFSKRKTSAQVAFVNGERLLGEDAAALAPRYPDLVFARARDLLGKLTADVSLKQLQHESLLQYKLLETPERRTVAVKAGKELYSAEELVASILHYAKGVAEKASEGAAVLDCTITVPPFFGPAQRQAVIDAAEVAGLNVLALVNTHTAAALQFGYYRNFENRSETVLLYDLGATSVSAALVKFSGLQGNGTAGKGKSASAKPGAPLEGMEVLDVAWDADTGAENLDRLLVEHFAAQFRQKHKKDVLANPRALAKLKRQVKRTKEILSANLEAPVSVEEIMDGIDFRSTISRQDFEELAGGFFKRAAAPAAELLARNGLAPEDVAAVELLGGGSRIPAVKATLSAALGGRSLDMHLDADEAVALGAGLVAANRSTTFRLRKFGVIEGAVYPITFQAQSSKGLKTEGAEGLLQPKALLPYRKRLPADRVAKLPNTTADTLRFVLGFNASGGRPLPPGHSLQLGEFEISGIKSVIDKHGETGRMSVHFRADESGRLLLTHAESVLDLTEEYTVKLPVAAKPSTTSPNDTAGIEEEAEAGQSNDTVAASPPPPALETVTKTRRKTVRVPLKIGGPGFARPGLTPAQLKASKAVLAGLAAADAARAETFAAKNDLEAYILATGDRVSDDEAVRLVSTEEQRGKLRAELAAAEDWLYMEGADEPAAVFRKKLAELSRAAQPMFERSKELSARPQAVEAARSFLDMLRKTINAWEAIKPWVNATDKAALLTEADAFETWLHEMEEQQAKLAGHDDPVLHSHEINARTEPVRKHFTRLKNVKKPKPPPAPDTNRTADNATVGDEAPGDNAQNDGVEVDAEAYATAGGGESTTETPSTHQHDELR